MPEEIKKRGRKPKELFIDFDGDRILLEFSDKEETDTIKRVGRLVYNKETKKVRFEGKMEKSAVLFFDYVSRYFGLVESKNYTVLTDEDIQKEEVKEETQ